MRARGHAGASALVSRAGAALRVTVLGGALVLLGAGCSSPAPGPDHSPDRGPTGAGEVRRLPADAGFDYQIGGDYAPAGGVRVVSRDWSAGSPLEGEGSYSICYVNAFQTQPDDPDVERPDERSAWPADLVLGDLGDDPEWGGEYLVDVSTQGKREKAAAWVAPMTDACAAEGFDAVEYDNLDSWTRFDGTPLAGDVPFGQDEAVAFATLLATHAHERGLAVAQKNTPQLGAEVSRAVGFDLAVAEQCGEYDECTAYTDVFGDQVVAVEYGDDGFDAACDSVGDEIAVVRRDVDVTRPGSDAYVFDAC